nr:MAG TPA_asm: Protein of unknown function (DUF2956) [Caudoviricetes sp.]
MGKSRKCTIIFNTSWGYCLYPIECESIAEGIKLAKSNQMPFRIMSEGKLIRQGWYVR